MKKHSLVQITCLLLMAGVFSLKAANGTWTNDASGNWSNTTQWLGGTVADASGSTADFSTINITADRTVTLDADHTLTTLKFGDTVPDFKWTLSGANTLTLAGTTPGFNVVNQKATISSVIAGTVGLTKTGAGTLALNGTTVNTFTGTLSLKAGTLTEDFSNLGSPVNLINSAVPLSLDGGALNILGNAVASSQTFNGVTSNPGFNVIGASNNSPTLNLGAFTQTVGSQTMFVGPAYISSASGAATPVTNAATGTITTTTLGNQNNLLWPSTRQAIATVGLYEWASVVTTPAGTHNILAGSQQPAATFYTTVADGGTAANGDLNYDLLGNAFFNNSKPAYVDTIRFNVPGAFTATTGAGGSGYLFLIGGILVTPNVGPYNTTFASGGEWIASAYTSAGNCPIDVYQNNIAGELFINTPFYYYSSTARATCYVKGGAGTVDLTGSGTSSGNYGSPYLNGGCTVINNNTQIGRAASAATLYLNGGTLVASGNTTLDNSGANVRPVTLLGNGGGLAAAAGNTMTIDGVIGSAAGTGPLVIGIPASAANGNVAGLLPGTGSIANGQTVDTANTTAVFGTGTVVLNGVGNTFYGGVTILGGATLNINSQWQLGGANQGPVTFNNGTLQYATTLLNSTVDISGQPVTMTGNGTIDVNGQTIAYANSIGNGGSGALTVKNSGVGGGLFLNGGTKYTGNTTVSSGGTLGGTGTIAGNVIWSSGAKASFTQGSPMTISGTATLNNNTVTVDVPGAALTDSGSPYTLMTATSIAGGSTVSSIPTMTGSGLAAGYNGAVSISGNSVILTVTVAGLIGTWTDGNATENWSEIGNWSGGVPHLAGSSAVFNSAGGSAVTLDADETVGSVTLNNPSSDVITGSGTVLTVDNNGFGAAFTVSDGAANVIAAPVALNEDTTVTVASGKSVAFSGIISNTASAKTLTINGAGTTVLSAANTYGPSSGSVGTTLSGGGTLQVGNSAALGAGDLTVTANTTLQAGATGLSLANNMAVTASKTVTVDNNGNNLILGGTISGGGALTKVGNGTLTLSGNNSFTGNATVNVGVLSVSAPENLVTPKILLNGGDLMGSGTFVATNNIGIGATSGSTPGTGLIDAASGQTFAVNGVISTAGNTGANNLTVNSVATTPGTVVLGGANLFKGTTVVSNGVLQLANSLALQNSTLNYSSGTLVFDGSLTAATLGGLSGTNDLGLTNNSAAAVALTLGNNNGAAVYTGSLKDIGSLILAGNGSQTIGSGATGGASYSGSTTVDFGTLVLGGVGMIITATDINLYGTLGSSYLNLVDTAAVTTSGGVYIASQGTGGNDGGNGYPAVSYLTVANNASLTAGVMGFGGAGSSRIPNLSSVTVTNNGTISVSGAFNLNNNAGSQSQTTLLNLNGGSLAVGNFLDSAAGATHQAQINFNGGMLKMLTNDPTSGPTITFLPVFTGLTVYVNSGAGALINANGFTNTIAANIVHGNGTPDGGLTAFGGGSLILGGANNYTGPTTVTNTTLVANNTYGTSATGGNTVNVLNNGILAGSGYINGPVAVNSGGHTLPGSYLGNTAGVTLTLNSNLTYNAGAEVDFNLGNLYYYGNDQIIVNGTLNGNGKSVGINLTDLVSTNLDTTGDYVLYQVYGTIASGFNSVPVWLGATPTNAAEFSVVTLANQVVLHYSPIIISSASATPNPAVRGQQVTFAVNATAGSYTIDPNTGVYLDASLIGGASPLYLVQSNGTSIYTNSVIVDSGTSLGGKSLTVAMSDSNGDYNSAAISLTIVGVAEVWNGLGGDNTWATGANWVSGIAPATGDFVTLAGTTQLTPNLETSYSISSLTFSNNAGSFNLTNAANTLTLLAGGVTNNSANAQTLSVPVALTSVAQTLNAAAGDLTLNQTVDNGGNLLTVADGGHATTLTGAIANNGGLTKTGNGTLTLGGANTYSGATTVKGGTVTVSAGGAINSGNTANVGQIIVGSVAGNAVLNIAGGTVNATKNTSPSLNLGNASGANGFLKLSSGSLATTSELHIGESTNAYGAFNLSGSGTVTVGSYFVVGGVLGGNGVFNMSGGTFTDNSQFMTIGGQANSYGVANLSGGGFNDNQGIRVGEAGQNFATGPAAGVLNVSGSAVVNLTGGTLNLGQNALSTGIANLLGGTLTANSVTKPNAAATGLLNFNGGILKAGASGTIITGLTAANIYSGGGTIDDGGQNITVAQPLLAPAGNGVSSIPVTAVGSNYLDTPIVNITGGGGTGAAAVAVLSGGTVASIQIVNPGTGYTSAPTVTLFGGGGTGATLGTPTIAANTSGGLTKQGAGTLTLTGTNTYTGNTTIKAGTLFLTGTGSIANSSVISVGSGAVFNVTGLTSGLLTLGSGQTLSNSASATGTLNGNIATGSGAIAVTYVSGTPALVVANGALTLSASPVFTIKNTGSTLAIGSYEIIGTNVNGSITGTVPSVAVVGNGVTAGAAASLQIMNGGLYLVVTSSGPSGPAYLTNSITGGNTLNLSWPAGQSWTLKVQTNHLDSGVSSNTNDWMTVPGSSSISQTNIIIDPAQPAEFYRLGYP